MNIVILGAAGFIGTNLIIALAKDKKNKITALDRSDDYLKVLNSMKLANVKCIERDILTDQSLDDMLSGQDIVYHLVSTTVPTTSNRHISQELAANVVSSSILFETCVRKNVNKVIFLSSGGAIYGKEESSPLQENIPTNPITSYGVQKLTIEKLLYLYHYMYGLDYRIIRLANPYGPYQRPNGVLGAVSTFTYKALRDEEIEVYGDGSVVRDFIYIDDAVKGILKIVNGENQYKTFNLGCGYGTSIKQVIDIVSRVLNKELRVKYTESRKVDVPVNYLDIRRYETAYGSLNPISLEEGIFRTAKFMKEFYSL